MTLYVDMLTSLYILKVWMGTQEIFPKDEASKQPLLSALQPELSFSFSQSYPN